MSHILNQILFTKNTTHNACLFVKQHWWPACQLKAAWICKPQTWGQRVIIACFSWLTSSWCDHNIRASPHEHTSGSLLLLSMGYVLNVNYYYELWHSRLSITAHYWWVKRINKRTAEDVKTSKQTNKRLLFKSKVL